MTSRNNNGHLANRGPSIPLAVGTRSS
jgi:hypothetical protein